jgi:hypothetical protein
VSSRIARPLIALALAFGLNAAIGAGDPLRAQGGPSAVGREPIMGARAVRAQRAPVIDGRDADEVWRTAPVIGGFRQFDPGEDLDPAFRTEARVAYDARYLYVLVRAFDPHPDSIVSLLSRRDVKTASDQLKIIIDPFHDRRNGVEMAVNPAGVKRDYAIYGDLNEDLTWDGVWDAGVSIDSLGWIAEFRVPFSQLRFGEADVHEFGFGIWRDIARLNERDAWPVYRKSVSALMSQLGTLDGIAGIAKVRRLELLPYSVAKTESYNTPTGPAMRARLTGGLDMKAGLTPNVIVDATINPDFGQVEADPAVLNLSAFEIRFDERRPFFQEGAGLYRCSGPCEGLFYTRRIGRTPQLRGSSDPAFTPIDGAVKLTGQFANGLSIGMVDAVTERVIGSSGRTVEPQSNYLVARALREWRGGHTQFGGQLTNVARSLDASTQDVLRRSATSILLQGYTDFANDSWRLTGYAAKIDVGGSARAIALTQLSSVHYYQRPDHEERFDSTRTTLSGTALSLQLYKRKGWWRSDTYVRRAGAGVEANDMGFVTLVNDQQLTQRFDLLQVTPSRFFRLASATATTESHWTTGGLPSARSAQLSANVTLTNSWQLIATTFANDIGGVNCVSCSRGGPVLTQSPKTGFRLDVIGDPRPNLVPRAAIRFGRSDVGRSWYRGADLSTELRSASRLSGSIAASFDHVVNDQQWVANFGAAGHDSTHYTFGRLDQNILTLTGRANFTATPTLSFQLYAQPFVTTGHLSEWRELWHPRAEAYADRFRPFSGPAGILNDFNVKQFNSNIVMRWEYRPASALFVVWQQGRQQGNLNQGSFDAPRDVRDLFGAHPDNTLLVKLSWWFNP